MTGPIAPIKVLELSEFVAGPYCGKLFADFGAEVIKIEAPAGDPARRVGPFPGDVPDPEQSGLFLYLNANKLGVTLDLGTDEGRKIFRDLVGDVDVLIEDRGPGVLEELGLGYDELAALNPGLVMVSLSAFGPDGPYRDYKAQPLNTFHASGQGYILPMMSPDFSREPVRGPGYLGEYDAGGSAAIAAMAALYWRNHGGTGQHVDISKQHAIMHLERSQLRRYVDTGVSPDRTGMGRLLELLVECRDGNFAILILSSQRQWDGLYEAMEQPEWARDPKFLTQASRSEHYDELRVHLAEWARTLTADEVFHRVQARKSACAPAQTAEMFHDSLQTRQRGYFVELEHPVAGVLEYPGRPYAFSNVVWTATRGAPLLGEHNAEILTERLAYASHDVPRLRTAGVI